MQRRGEKQGVRRGQVRDEVQAKPSATYKVNHSDELMEFLLRKCNTSRNNVKSLLVRRQVLVNGSVVTQYNFPLAKDDEVKLSKRPVKEGEAPEPMKAPRMAVKKAAPARAPRFSLKILYEDNDFIAVDKPVGLLSVESDTETDSAYAQLLAHFQARDKSSRPFLLHRIDKETSGVLVFAKDIKIHSKMKMKWNELVSAREYHALVEGVPAEKSGTITSYLKENKNHLMYSTQDPSGQKAITHYETVKTGNGYALLKVKIDTGRKNQIRVHMQTMNTPVVGDEKYGHPKTPIGRLGLHASRLEFMHPDTGEIISITSPLPPAFKGLF